MKGNDSHLRGTEMTNDQGRIDLKKKKKNGSRFRSAFNMHKTQRQTYVSALLVRSACDLGLPFCDIRPVEGPVEGPKVGTGDRLGGEGFE